MNLTDRMDKAWELFDQLDNKWGELFNEFYWLLKDTNNASNQSSGSINELAQEVYNTAKDHGWYDENRTVGDVLSLIHSEVSEALEEYRSNPDVHHSYYRDSDGKPEGFFFELADVLIRVLDCFGAYGVDPYQYVREKMDFNATRPYRHGNKAL